MQVENQLSQGLGPPDIQKRLRENQSDLTGFGQAAPIQELLSSLAKGDLGSIGGSQLPGDFSLGPQKDRLENLILGLELLRLCNVLLRSQDFARLKLCPSQVEMYRKAAWPISSRKPLQREAREPVTWRVNFQAGLPKTKEAAVRVKSASKTFAGFDWPVPLI